MGPNYASYHCKHLDIWKQSIWKEKSKSHVYQYSVKWVQSSVIIVWSLQVACPLALRKTWRSGMKSPIADKNGRTLQDNHFCFNLLTRAFTCQQMLQERTESYIQRTSTKDNTLYDPWKSDQKFCPCIAQSCGIGKKPENLSNLI